MSTCAMDQASGRHRCRPVRKVGAKIAALCMLAPLVPCGVARAGLLGTPVTGSLNFQGNPTNYFDPTNTFVPAAGFENSAGTTVPISATQVEFGFQDGINLDTADFAATSLTVTDADTGGGSLPFVMTFTDAAFAGLQVGKVTDVFGNGGLSFSLTGTTLTVSAPLESAVATSTATFSLGSTGGTTAATPLPTSATAGLGLLGLLGVAQLRRRRPLAV